MRPAAASTLPAWLATAAPVKVAFTDVVDFNPLEDGRTAPVANVVAVGVMEVMLPGAFELEHGAVTVVFAYVMVLYDVLAGAGGLYVVGVMNVIEALVVEDVVLTQPDVQMV